MGRRGHQLWPQTIQQSTIYGNYGLCRYISSNMALRASRSLVSRHIIFHTYSILLRLGSRVLLHYFDITMRMCEIEYSSNSQYFV